MSDEAFEKAQLRFQTECLRFFQASFVRLAGSLKSPVTDERAIQVTAMFSLHVLETYHALGYRRSVVVTHMEGALATFRKLHPEDFR